MQLRHRQNSVNELKSLLSPECVLFDYKASCKRDALSAMAECVTGKLNIEAEDILNTILEREHLGSTGVGNGIAIPHGKLAGIDKMIAVLARLEQPVDYDAVDGQPVDILIMLLAPEDSNAEHLKILSKVARLLRKADIRAALRGANSPEALYAIVTDDTQNEAA